MNRSYHLGSFCYGVSVAYLGWLLQINGWPVNRRELTFPCNVILMPLHRSLLFKRQTFCPVRIISFVSFWILVAFEPSYQWACRNIIDSLSALSDTGFGVYISILCCRRRMVHNEMWSLVYFTLSKRFT